MDGIWATLGLATGSAILTLGVKHFLDNPFREIAFNIPWLRIKAGSLAGYWFAEYGFHECGNESKHTSVSVLYELIEWPGNIVLIREIPINDEPAAIVIKAKKRNGYLSGTYENVADHDILHGVFQLWVHPRGKKMHGRFLGFSAESPNHINVGDWQWSRLTATRKNGALDEAKIKFAEHKRIVESRTSNGDTAH